MEEKKSPWRTGSAWGSFKNALKGIVHIINHHKNARLIFLCAVLVIILGFYMKITRLEMFIVGFTVMLVFITEVINTVIEDIADLINEEYHQKIKVIKDATAGVVLVSVFFSLFVGYFVFIERLLGLRR